MCYSLLCVCVGNYRTIENCPFHLIVCVCVCHVPVARWSCRLWTTWTFSSSIIYRLFDVLRVLRLQCWMQTCRGKRYSNTYTHTGGQRRHGHANITSSQIIASNCFQLTHSYHRHSISPFSRFCVVFFAFLFSFQFLVIIYSATIAVHRIVSNKWTKFSPTVNAKLLTAAASAIRNDTTCTHSVNQHSFPSSGRNEIKYQMNVINKIKPHYTRAPSEGIDFGGRETFFSPTASSSFIPTAWNRILERSNTTSTHTRIPIDNRCKLVWINNSKIN